MIEFEKTTPPWLQQIVDRFESVGEIFPDPHWMQGELPLWVQNVGREIMKGIFPTAHLKVGRYWEIGEVAALVGQNIAYSDSIMAEVCESEQLDRKKWDNLRKILGDDIEERAEEYARKLTEEFLPAFEEAVKFSLTLAGEQDYASMRRFFKAFSRALDRRPISAGDIGRTNTRIYWVLLLSWRRVEEFGSIPELHRRLCKCVFLGPHLVGDLKRIEKICERIGLSYREIAQRKERAEVPKNNSALSGDKNIVSGHDANRGNKRSRKRRCGKAGVRQKRSRQSSKH
jgi:hypothetical protein